MTKKHFLNEILIPKLLVGVWGFILVICVFIGFSIRGKCADVTDTLTFPLGFEDAHALNNWYADSYEVLISDVNVGPLMQDSDYIIVPIDLDYYGYWDNWSWWFITLVAVPVEDFPNVYPNSLLSQTAIKANYVTGKQGYIFQLWIDERGNNPTHIDNFQESLNIDREFFGARNSESFYNYTFISSYPVYWGKNFYSVNDTQILRYTEEPITQGHATPPDLTGDNIGDDKPDIDDYLPNIPTMPTLDDSSLEKIAESIFNILQWGFNAIKGTLQGLFEYLGDLLSYSFQKVIDNIKNAIQNLYDNFVSLFEPLLNSINEILDSISQKLDYISQPFDSEELQEAFENTAISVDIDSISQLNEQAFGTWSTTEEPNEFKIALHTEQIPLANNVNFTASTQYIDLGVINGAKPYIRGVMWCLLTFSLLYTIIDSIPNYIGGYDE